MRTIGVDVGGSSIKAGIVEVATGQVVESVKVRIEDWTDPSSTIDIIARTAAGLGDGDVGVGFPAVVDAGRLMTDPTSHEYPGWVRLEIAAEIADRLGRPVAVANDADVAALAERQHGAARGRGGTVVVLTLGTGIGSGVLIDGRLVPNVELGRLYLAGHEHVVEDHCAARIRTEQHLDWPTYAQRLQDFLTHVERLMSPRLFIIGGGISAEAEKFLPLLSTRAEVVPAALRAHAGVVGAATLAVPDE